MEGRNRYIVDSREPISADYVKSISVFYLPLIGKRASSLYLQLLMEKENRLDCTLERLCTLAHLNINELEETVTVLEKYELLKTMKSGDDYLFLVKSPLSVRQFLEHEVYSRMYLNSVGEKQYEISRRAYLPSAVDSGDYEDISHKFDPQIMSVWNQQDEERYQKITRPAVAGDVEIDFDYGEYVRKTTPLVFPVSLRTNENMEAIGRLGTIFAISPDNMHKLVGDSITKDRSRLDLELLRKKCLACKEADYQPGENEFDVSPVAYLQHRQQAPVSQADKKMLENLMVEYRLPRQVINILVDYTLNNTNNRLDRNYIEKIAATLMRQGIDTADKAREALNRTPAENRTGRKKAVFSASEMDAGELDVEELRRKLYGEESRND